MSNKKDGTSIKYREPIRIRYKKLSDGSKSIFFAHWDKSKWAYEFLKLYLIPEKTRKDKKKNEETMALVQAIKAKRIVELKNEEFGFKNKTISKASFFDYIDSIADRHLADTGNKYGEYYNFKSLNLHLKLYKGDNIRFKDIDKAFVHGFIDYLKNATNQNLHKNKKSQTISSNTQNKLFNKLNSALNQAKINELISENPVDLIDKKNRPKAKKGTREYLTIDEVKQLIDTDCNNDHVKRAFLFCCLTGLRFSDVSKIKFENFRKNNNGDNIINFDIKKSDKNVTMQISKSAMQFVYTPEDAQPEDRVFKLGKNETVNPILAKWVKDAGITKTITFHCSRHTAATLNLSLGIPIAIVSNLLGHSKIATTEIYAKIVDDAQREAVNKQDGIFDIEAAQ